MDPSRFDWRKITYRHPRKLSGVMSKAWVGVCCAMWKKLIENGISNTFLFPLHTGPDAYFTKWASSLGNWHRRQRFVQRIQVSYYECYLFKVKLFRIEKLLWMLSWILLYLEQFNHSNAAPSRYIQCKVYLIIKADRRHLCDYLHTPTDDRHTDKHLRLVVTLIALCCTRQSRAPNIDRCAPEIWPWPMILTPTFDFDLKAR